jgi:hypothetical protein
VIGIVDATTEPSCPLAVVIYSNYHCLASRRSVFVSTRVRVVALGFGVGLKFRLANSYTLHIDSSGNGRFL